MLFFSRYSWWVGAMVGLALLLAVFAQVGVLGPFQGAFLRITAPVEGLFEGIFRPIASFLSDAGNLDELQDENRQLRVENEDLRNQIVELERDTERIEELTAALGLVSTDPNAIRVAAEVVNRVSTPFDSAISIDRGSADGLKEGMVVQSAQGTLIGTVTHVLEHTSFVRLITDSRSKVNAQVQESKVEGIVKGNPGRTLTFDLAQAEVKVGDTIITSGLGGNYPPGLPIGKVTEVTGSSQDLYKKVKVEPFVRMSTASTVLVLTSFIPQRIDINE